MKIHELQFLTMRFKGWKHEIFQWIGNSVKVLFNDIPKWLISMAISFFSALETFSFCMYWEHCRLLCKLIYVRSCGRKRSIILPNRQITLCRSIETIVYYLDSLWGMIFISVNNSLVPEIYTQEAKYLLWKIYSLTKIWCLRNLIVKPFIVSLQNSNPISNLSHLKTGWPFNIYISPYQWIPRHQYNLSDSSNDKA